MPSFVPPKRAIAYTFYIGLVSQANTKILQANPTLAAGDVKIAIDDGAPANLGTLPVVDADFTKRVKVVLSAAEMTGDNLTVIFSDAAGAEWCDLIVNIQTAARQIDDLAFPVVSGRGMDVDATGGVEITPNQAVNAAQWAGAATATDDVALATAPVNFAALSITAAGLVDITQAAADKVWASTTRTLSAFSTALALSVWDVLETAIVTASSIGLKVKNNLDAAISSRMATYTQPSGFLAATFPPDPADQSLIIAATDAITADTNDIQARLPAVLVGGRIAANAEVVGDKTGYALSAAGITAIWAEVMEGVVTAVQMMRGFASALLGKASGLSTTTAVYRDIGDTKDRITATVDAYGNRSAVTRDLS